MQDIKYADIIIINIYKLTKLKEDTGNSTIIVGDFNTSFSVMNTTRQIITKEMEDLNNVINQLHLTDIHRTLYLHIAKYMYTFFFSVNKKFFRIDCILGHKTISIHLKILKPYKVSSLTIKELNQKSITTRKLENLQICGN